MGRGIETKDSVALALAPPLTDAGAEIFGRKRAPRAPACGLWLQEVQYDGAASDPGGVVGGVSVTAGKLAKAVKAQRRRVKRKARKRRLGESKAEGAASKGAVRKKRRALVSACLRKVQTQTTNEKSETLKPTTTEPANKASQPPDAAESARQRAERAREQAVKRRQKRMQEQTQQDEARRAAIQNLLRRTGE